MLPLPGSPLGEQGLWEVENTPQGHPKMPRGGPPAQSILCAWVPLVGPDLPFFVHFPLSPCSSQPG